MVDTKKMAVQPMKLQAPPVVAIPEIEFDPNSEEMQKLWYKDMVKWFGELDEPYLRNFARYFETAKKTLPANKAELVALKAVAEDIYIHSGEEVPETVKAIFRLGRGEDRKAFLATLDAHERMLFDFRSVELMGECVKRGLVCSWLEAEQYGAACVKAVRKYSIHEALAYMKRKKNEFLDKISQKGRS